MIQTKDGGYIALGTTTSNDGDVIGQHGFQTTDLWVIKMSSDGSLEWQKCLGGSDFDSSSDIEQTADDGYILIGTIESFDGDVFGNHGGGDAWVVKLNAEGSIVWKKAIGSSAIEMGASIHQTPDGGYLGAGSKNSSYWLFKLNSAGTLLWQKTYGGSGHEQFGEMQLTNDNGAVLLGSSWSNDGQVTGHHGGLNTPDYWVVKVDSIGTLEWQKSLGGSIFDQGLNIIQTSDGGYFLSGRSYSNDGDVSGYHGDLEDPDAWIVKLNSIGDIEWQKALGGSKWDEINQLIETTDTNLVLIGMTVSPDGDVNGTPLGGDFWLLKMNMDGVILWQMLLGSSDFDLANSVWETEDRGLVLGGHTDGADGDVTEVGYDQGDIWVVKLGPTVGTEELVNQIATTHRVFPNPSSRYIQFKTATEDEILDVQVLDCMGRTICRQTLRQSEILDISSFPNGMYVARATNANGEFFVEKFEKQH